jgi:hypothetical protein
MIMRPAMAITLKLDESSEAFEPSISFDKFRT